MNNKFLGQITDLIASFTGNYSSDFSVGMVSIGKNEDYEFYEEDKQSADYEHLLLDSDEFVSQCGVGDGGDSFEGTVLRKIAGTDYCLVLEYST